MWQDTKIEDIRGDMQMSKIATLVKQHPTTAFFILTFIFSWGFNPLAEFVYSATNSVLLAVPLALLSRGPLLSALVVTAIIGGKPGVSALLRKFTKWRVGLLWYLIALFLQPALNLAAIYLNMLLGAPAPAAEGFGPGSSLLAAFAFRLINPFDGPMLEELGWRGFAQPHLQEGYSPLVANLILAVVVTIWHLRLIPAGDYAWIEIPGTIAITLIYGWVYNATGGSVLLTLMMHATEPLLWVSSTGAYETQGVLLRVALFAIAAVIVVLMAGKNLGRRGAEPTPAGSMEAQAL
jgi:membrane protease YdiL (CAAX protease family)